MHWRIKKKKFGKLNSIFRMTVLTAQWSHSSNKTSKGEEKTVKNKIKQTKNIPTIVHLWKLL